MRAQEKDNKKFDKLKQFFRINTKGKHYIIMILLRYK